LSIRRCILLLLLLGSQLSLHAQEDSVTMDSTASRISKGRLPFIDSLLSDTLSQALAAPFKIKTPTAMLGKVKDPFDPFNKEIFLRHGLGKFWFFVVSMLVVGLILYFRSAFPNQLILRIRSLFNGYYFRELISEFGISFTSGSVVAGVISTLVLAQAVVVIVVFSGYVNLNSIVFYLLVVVVVVLWKVFLLFVQRLQAFVLDLSEVSRNQTQRQINIDFGVSMLIFPFVTLAYFNASRLAGVDVALIMVVMITVWFTLRVILEFLGLFRESGFSLSGILYFCGFEILPHTVLLTALFRMYNA
jgi:hypothetical protein